MMKGKGPYIGIDVAKAHLDLAAHLSGDPWRVSNDDAGISAIRIINTPTISHRARTVISLPGGNRAVQFYAGNASM